MNCDDFKHALHDLYLGTLADARKPELERHAAACAECRRFREIATEMTCREFVEFLNDYLDERLSEARRAVFGRHLSICADCHAYLESYRATMEMSVWALRSNDPAGLGREVPPDLVRAILDACSRE